MVFVSTASEWVRHFDGGSEVNVAHADPEAQRWVSTSGRGELVEDRARAHALWNRANEAWFPGGPDDPTLCLLRVEVEHADYWDGSGSRILRLASMVRALETGQRPDPGDHGQLDLG